MNKRIILTTLFLSILTILLTGCVFPTSASIKPSPLYGQEVLKIKDLNFIGSKDTNVALVGSVLTSIEVENHPILMVSATNNSENPIEFSTMNIRASYGNRSINIYTEDEFSEYLEWEKHGEIRSSSSNISMSPANRYLSIASYLSGTAVIADRYNKLQNAILRNRVIEPGETYGGLIMLQKLQHNDIGNPLILRLLIGSEVHEIRFSILKDA